MTFPSTTVSQTRDAEAAHAVYVAGCESAQVRILGTRVQWQNSSEEPLRRKGCWTNCLPQILNTSVPQNVTNWRRQSLKGHFKRFLIQYCCSTRRGSLVRGHVRRQPWDNDKWRPGVGSFTVLRRNQHSQHPGQASGCQSYGTNSVVHVSQSGHFTLSVMANYYRNSP